MLRICFRADLRFAEAKSAVLEGKPSSSQHDVDVSRSVSVVAQTHRAPDGRRHTQIHKYTSTCSQTGAHSARSFYGHLIVCLARQQQSTLSLPLAKVDREVCARRRSRTRRPRNILIMSTCARNVTPLPLRYAVHKSCYA